MKHTRVWRTIAAVQERDTVTSPTDLPPNVRRLVDEIETEMGESDVGVDDIVGSRYDEHAGEDARNGRVEVGGSPDPRRDRRRARTARAWPARPAGSTGCTPS